MTIAYIRTYSNKQQTESQKKAIEQFAKAKKMPDPTRESGVPNCNISNRNILLQKKHLSKATFETENNL